MKCEIFISGQISGNFKLFSALNNGNSKKGMFNSFHIFFDTIGEAKKEMRSGRKYLVQNEDKNCCSLSKDCERLNYDASKAVIIKIEGSI